MRRLDGARVVRGVVISPRKCASSKNKRFSLTVSALMDVELIR